MKAPQKAFCSGRESAIRPSEAKGHVAFELHTLFMACVGTPWTHCGRQLQCMRQEAHSARDGPAPSASMAPSAWRATRSSCASREPSRFMFILMMHFPDMVKQRGELDLPGIAESLPAAPWDHTPWRAPRALPRFLDVLGPPIIRELVLCKKDFHEPRPRSMAAPTLATPLAPFSGSR